MIWTFEVHSAELADAGRAASVGETRAAALVSKCVALERMAEALVWACATFLDIVCTLHTSPTQCSGHGYVRARTREDDNDLNLQTAAGLLL